MDTLAGFGDEISVQIIDKHIDDENDHALRTKAAELLAASDHAAATTQLEKRIKHKHDSVRLAALSGLRRQLGEDDLRPLRLAIDVETIGPLAVEALVDLAKKDDQALALLINARASKLKETRLASLSALETVYDANSPEPTLIALDSSFADVRKRALIRFHQRQLLGEHRVRSAIRRAGDDDDPDVRQTAFLVSLFASPKLVQGIRERDEDLHRLLFEIETFADQSTEAKSPPQLQPTPVTLTSAELAPVLQAMASQTLDTSLLGARSLASLGDPRAFGILLQLSRESNDNARVQVCRALAKLNDPRVVERLVSLLHDDNAEVRDAAFTSLSEIQKDQPLESVESGLASPYENVRRRALKALVDHARGHEPNLELLERALNDSEGKIRSEAFKAVLNLEIGGAGEGALRFALNSTHADIRREVLTEVMAQYREPWAWQLLLSLFNDPDSSIRAEALEFAIDKSKDDDVAPMKSALQSEYPDLRRSAVAQLAKIKTEDAQAALTSAVNDEDNDTRFAALEHLINIQADASVRTALTSTHADTQLRAAQALAKQGDPAVLTPLMTFAQAEEPEGTEEQLKWIEQIAASLRALGELGDRTATELVFSMLRREEKPIRRAAAEAIVYVSNTSDSEKLYESVRHEDKEVAARAALALALNSDPVSIPVVTSPKFPRKLERVEAMAAVLALGNQIDDNIATFLSQEEPAPQVALRLVYLLEVASQEAAPKLAIAGLSSAYPEIRFACANAIEQSGSTESLTNHVLTVLNVRERKDDWQINKRTLQEMAALAALGGNRVRLRFVKLLHLLLEDDEDAWNLAWTAFHKRFAYELATLALAPQTRRLPQNELNDIAFGSYVGLLRDDNASSTVRQNSVRRLTNLGGDAVRQALVQFLGDGDQALRQLVYESLLTLNMDRLQLAGDCLESGRTDIGIKGLELLSGGGSEDEANQILRDVALTRTDYLAIEAANLLVKRTDEISTAIPLLDAAYDPMKRQAVGWLATNYEVEAAAEALRGALNSRYELVRQEAAIYLATRKDPAAFETLIKLVGEVRNGNYYTLYSPITTLGDPRTPAALLQLVEDGKIDKQYLDWVFNLAASFRQEDVVPQLLKMTERDEWRHHAINATYAISGHNQPIQDLEDERPEDRKWMDEQHPRNDAVLRQLLAKITELNLWDRHQYLLHSAAWSLANEVDPVLATLVHHSDDEVRRSAVKAVSFRVRKRGSSPDPLVAALEHRDAITKFHAAEGLARAGRDDGISVLLAAIDLMDDFMLRKAAVVALGELGDERALEVLLKLANEDAHALQEAAAEAIGHMGKSDQAEEIFELLVRFVKGSQSGLAEHAVRGLRWFDTREGWQLIRSKANEDEEWEVANAAVEALGYNDEPATRNLLLKLLSASESYLEPLDSARRVFGQDSLEPDYAVLSSGDDEFFFMEDSINRVNERGEPNRIFEVLSRAHPEIVDPLHEALLIRDPLPETEAAAAISTDNEAAANVAAHIVGRGNSAAAWALAERISYWLEQYREVRKIAERGDWDAKNREQRILETANRIVWAAGKRKAGETQLLSCLADRELDQSLRLAALRALANFDAPNLATLSAIETAASDPSAAIRELAASTLSQIQPARAANVAANLISDRSSFRRIADRQRGDLAESIRTGAAHPHFQPIALPYADEATLIAVANDTQQSETTRLGAIEGLAALATTSAEDELAKIGKDESADEELRKAAWRGLRRSKRARQKQEKLAAG
ncbi:MAG: HEAT repeat domain-containing protein [Verrucomicrobiota bacterium]